MSRLLQVYRGSCEMKELTETRMIVNLSKQPRSVDHSENGRHRALWGQLEVLLSVTVLERHVARISTRVQERLWVSLIRGISATSKESWSRSLQLPTVVTSPCSIVCARGRFAAALPNLSKLIFPAYLLE
jgi:hypothetical protein